MYRYRQLHAIPSGFMVEDMKSSFPLAGLLLLAACFPKTVDTPPTLAPEQIASAGSREAAATPTALARGREVFAAKCNGCHGYPAADAVSEAKWPKVMRAMGEKSDLTPDESHDALRFILAARTRP
ncbi:MAG: hypothetical protein KF764_14330 [Labilithrix sp.]|nr:hypothetical protein [Labilithrix sp.]MBX3221321.1 hypothetical protein [Labilithrix sp.]